MTDDDAIRTPEQWQEYKQKRLAELEKLWSSGHRLGVGKDGRLYDTYAPKGELTGRRK